MDFIVVLFEIEVDVNMLLIIINKLLKKILLISNKNKFKIKDWINIIFKKFMWHNWKLFVAIISDCD